MIEKLITKIKTSLSGGAKNNADSDEDLDEEVNNSLNADEESDSADVESEEEKKKKKTSMIIRVVVILGIAYFAVDEFLMKKDEVVEEVVVKKPARKKPVKVSEEEPIESAEETQKPAKIAEKSPSESMDITPESSTPEAEVAPIENVNILDKEESASPEVATEVSPPAEETRVPQPTVEQSLDQISENVGQATEPAPVEVVQVPSANNSNDMASKIVETTEQTAPPSYDQLGRGLVYNCTGKFWACVDKPSYITCNKNMKWNQSTGAKAECVVQAIYNSEEDCAKIQKYNVSTNMATDFCKN